MSEGKSNIFTCTSSNQYSDFDNLSYWMYLASSSVFDSDSFSRQPKCDDELLSTAIDAFGEMLQDIHLANRDLGIIMVYINKEEVIKQLDSIGDIFNILGTLGNQLHQIKGMLDRAYNMRLEGKYSYQPDRKEEMEKI